MRDAVAVFVCLCAPPSPPRAAGDSLRSMNPQTMVFVGGAETCGGIIVGLLFLVVGLVTVRASLPRAGYLVGAAGALEILGFCCTSWQEPNQWYGFVPALEGTGAMLGFVVGMLAHVVAVALLIAGGALLAKETLDRREGTSTPGANT